MVHSTSGSRPVYLNLAKIKLPIPGVMSIMHRISGVLMVLAIPVILYLSELSLSGPEGFAAAAGMLDRWWIKLAALMLIWSLMHHLLAGIRYLLLDIHIGITRRTAYRTAQLVIAGGLALTVLFAGVLL